MKSITILKIKKCYNNIVLSFIFNMKQPLKNLNNSFFDYEIDNIKRKIKNKKLINIRNKRIKKKPKNKIIPKTEIWEIEIIENIKKNELK